MKIIRNYKNCPLEARNSILTLGNFDGVHKGHRAIIEKVKNIASEKKTSTALITFEPHPIEVLKGVKEPFRLTPFKDKAKLLEDMGLDYLFPIRFDKNFSLLNAEDFVKKILIGSLNIKHVVVGGDFIFGHKRSGNTEYLKKSAEEAGFGLSEMEDIGENQSRFSSTQIRSAIKNANLKEAKRMLGRNFSISGKVKENDGRGKSIGFATANLNLKNYLRPKFGVYAVKTEISGEKYDAVANIGVRPTFDGANELLEAHIFNFNEDIYGKKIKVELVEFIREERKFQNADELKKQINLDVERAKECLKKE